MLAAHEQSEFCANSRWDPMLLYALTHQCQPCFLATPKHCHIATASVLLMWYVCSNTKPSCPMDMWASQAHVCQVPEMQCASCMPAESLG